MENRMRTICPCGLNKVWFLILRSTTDTGRRPVGTMTEMPWVYQLSFPVRM